MKIDLEKNIENIKQEVFSESIEINEDWTSGKSSQKYYHFSNYYYFANDLQYEGIKYFENKKSIENIKIKFIENVNLYGYNKRIVSIVLNETDFLEEKYIIGSLYKDLYTSFIIAIFLIGGAIILQFSDI